MAGTSAAAGAPVKIPRGYIDTPNVITGANVNLGGNTNFTNQWPMGFGYYGINLRFTASVTPGATPPVGPITDNFLLLIKNILFQSDRAENFCNLPARALAFLNQLDSGALPQIDQIGVAAGNYYMTLHIPFVDWRMLRPQDTVVDTSRYNSCKLTVTAGTAADIWATPNTGTFTLTMDADIESSYGPLPGEYGNAQNIGAKPLFYRELDFNNPIDASGGSLFVDLKRAEDLAIRKYLVHSCTGGTAGQPMSGANANSVILSSSFQTQAGYIKQNQIAQMVQRENLMSYRLPAVQTGLYVYDFVRDRSNGSALATGNKTYLHYNWVNNGAQAAGNLVTVVSDGLRALAGKVG
ncbi:MAG: hypothetical protein ACYCVY_13280 [Acidiferrobacteraceae bacterium]